MRTREFGALIRNARMRKGWTQQELAERLNVDRANVSQVETGSRQWPQSLIGPLAQALGLSQVEMAVAAGLIDDPGGAVAEESPTYSADPDLDAIAEVWPHLDDEERELIARIIDYFQFPKSRVKRKLA